MKRFGAIALGCAVACFGYGQTSDRLIYDQVDSGFQFTYPPDWTLKKTRQGVTLTVPLADTERKAILEVYGNAFTGDIPMWQAIQNAAAKDMKHEVVRQWQEEILTVPLLMGRTQWEEKGVPMTADIALVYAETPKMLVFRLEAATEDFPKAEAKFRDVLQTLRQATGRIPQPFDPTKPRPKENLVRTDNEVKRWTFTGKPNQKPPGPPVKGDLSIESLAGTLPVIVRYSGQWKATVEGGTVTFEQDGVKQDVKVTAFSVIEGLRPDVNLVRTSAASLEPFTKVQTSTQKGWLTSRSGAQLGIIERVGKADTVNLRTFDAVVLCGDYYLVLTWRSVDADATKMREKVFDLMQSLSVEAKTAS